MFSIIILAQLEKKINQKYDSQIKITLTSFMVKIIFLLHVQTVKKLLSFISSLIDNKSHGPNGIPTRILKLLKMFQHNYLIFLISLFLTLVIPIHKKDSKLECSNYRSALLSNNKLNIWKNKQEINLCIHYNLDLDKIIQLLIHYYMLLKL